MKQTRIMMGMPITLEIVDEAAGKVLEDALDAVFAYFTSVDNRFSTYKEESEISQINRQQITLAEASDEMRSIFFLAEETRLATDGYFDIQRNGKIDPSGLVKGWAIQNAADLLQQWGFHNYYVDAGGDMQVAGHNAQGKAWRLGIRSPFNLREIVKVLAVTDCGVATSGDYIRGRHIYNPKSSATLASGVVSLTVIGAKIYDADRFATAAFAMGRQGIAFIEQLPGFEGYQIDQDGMAVFTSGFKRYLAS